MKESMKTKLFYLFVFAFLFWVVGDLVTTYIGLTFAGLRETSSVIRFLLKHSFALWVLLKLIAFFPVIFLPRLDRFFFKNDKYYITTFTLVYLLCLGVVASVYNLYGILYFFSIV